MGVKPGTARERASERATYIDASSMANSRAREREENSRERKRIACATFRERRIVETIAHAVAIRAEYKVFDKYGAGLLPEERVAYEYMLRLGDDRTIDELEALACGEEDVSQAMSAIEGELEDARAEAVDGLERAKRRRASASAGTDEEEKERDDESKRRTRGRRGDRAGA